MNWERWYKYLIRKFGEENVKVVKAGYTETLAFNYNGKWIPIYYEYVDRYYRVLVMITVKNLAVNKKNLTAIIDYHLNNVDKLKVVWRNGKASLYKDI